MGFIMLIFVLAVCAVVLMLGLKLFPVYSQLFNVKTVMKALANSEEVKSGTVSDIRKSFDRRAHDSERFASMSRQTSPRPRNVWRCGSSPWLRRFAIIPISAGLVRIRASANW